MKNIYLIILIIFIFACTATKKQEPKQQSFSLELLWESDTLLTTAESVIYDRERDVIYVANVNLNPWEKDGNGFISKLDMDGNIAELKWVEGLDAPKGMGIVNGSLFVNDIDQIIEIDIATRKIKGRTKIGGDPGLNDITVGENGVIYASGSNSQKIYQLENGILDIVLDGDLGRPNGVLYAEDHLLMVSSNSNKLFKINLATKEMVELADSLGRADGIVALPAGGYLVSNWQGEIYHISQNLHRTKILDTRNEKINSADIDFVREKNILLIPTFFDNRVKAYKLIE
ncbi:hypothetical protein [Reichenbachiella sp. MALMAid0571]|uniref:hypothetical protein n=1 Tax=Reichenbachiella sp. MALMAid0571 TaxID=3143939 RepID=UPI0032DFF367